MRLPTRLLRRNPDAHKKDYGHVFILAGSARYSGAAVLCAEAAQRMGAGLVTLGLPKSLNAPVIKIKIKEVMTLPLAETAGGALSISAYKQIINFTERTDVFVLGPGLGLDKSTVKLARKLIPAVTNPQIIDADGLNAVAGEPEILGKAAENNGNIIITPNLGEMSRLLGGLSIEEIKKNKKEIARKFAKDFGVTVVMKGNNTVVADKTNLYINKTGNPGMATAGSGDVLAGMIAALAGQGLNCFDAAKYGVYLHGLAADLAAKEKTQICLIASDIIGKIPDAVKMSS